MEPQQNDGSGSDGWGLSIVMPAYNEARRLPGTLPRVIEYASRLGEPAEIIVVDDGSTDATGDVVAAAARPGDPVVVLRSSSNRGKGAAVRQGMLTARFGHVLFTDVDLSTPIEETTKLRAALARGADVAIGSRRLAESDVRGREPRLRELAGRTSSGWCHYSCARASTTAGAGARCSADPRRVSCSAGRASTDSDSMRGCCGSRAGSGTRSPRCPSSGATTTGATSGSCGTRVACCSTWVASVSTAGRGATP